MYVRLEGHSYHLMGYSNEGYMDTYLLGTQPYMVHSHSGDVAKRGHFHSWHQ